MKKMKLLCVAFLGMGLAAFAAEKKADRGPVEAAQQDPTTHVYPTMGNIERLDPAVDALLGSDAHIEKLAGGFEWSEGPVWVPRAKYLLFSDVPRNVVFLWKEGVPTTDYMIPSGYTGKKARAGEPGSNGLTLDAQGRLVLCQHGDRQIARQEHDGKVTVLARYYNYRRFNSPNDLVYKKNGDLYFTDPPYGLEGNIKDPAKEIMFQGVYRLTKDGKVDLLTRDLTFPNGIAFSPDEKTLYVAVSDPKAPNIWAYEVDEKGMIQNGRVFFNASHLMEGRKGLPDGLKVDLKGNLWATGPGGVLIISPEGKHLGTINTGEATANCAWGNDGSTLYITADMFLCRVKTLTKGQMPGK
ncbi:MAG TPA: SMP-30/gluconolactonase/LRE family protein [Verrucomicrobiae bacterium]|nr:SMP-30/gluconolactonase/LRE family protein [Verrucomicrobiae bacterium]